MCIDRELSIFSYDEPGFKTQLCYDNWKVSLLNCSDMYFPDNISYFDRHLLTDEVFILLAGSVGILTAGKGNKPESTIISWMKEGVLYNVCQNTWHTLYMLPGSKLAVIENQNTELLNSPRYYLTKEEKNILLPRI